MACKEIVCTLDPSGSVAGKSYSTMLNDDEFKQETFDGRDTTSY